MIKVLVTGATGFVGNYVVEKLLEKDLSVIASSSNRDTAIHKAWFKNVTYVPLDIKNIDDKINYFEFFNKPDALIHLAWQGLPNYNEDFHVSENLPKHFSFLKNIIENGLKSLTVTGTCLEYGLIEGCLNESLEVKPTTCYGIAKNELRIMLEALSNEYAFNLKWLRLFYMYGKGQSPKSLLSQLEKAVNDNEPEFKMSGGEQLRDFLPVEKMAEYIVDAAMQDEVSGIINCCSGKSISVYDFVLNYLKQQNKTIKLLTGYYPYTVYEPMEFWGDNNKLKSILKNE